MKEQKFIGSLVAGLFAIGALFLGFHQLIFTRTEGEGLAKQIERLEEHMNHGFDEMREDMRTFIGHQRSAKNTSMVNPIKKKNTETGYAISEDAYQELRRRARKESGHEFFSFKDSFGDDSLIKHQ